MDESLSLQDAAAATPAGIGQSSIVPVLDAMREMLQAGGPVVIILLLMSMAALAIIFVKMWQFHQARLSDRKPAWTALRLYQAHRVDDALRCLDGVRAPSATVLACAIRGQRRGIAEAKVREEVWRYGSDILEELRALFRPLEVIATLAPLLGLFGTVLGMIDAFRQLESAGSQVNPSILSGGIWEALLTTAVGLGVAIPVVAVLSWMERRVDRIAYELESLVTQVFTEDLSEESEVTKERQIHEPVSSRPAAFAAGE
ncbi:MAG: MotA/TolQ/ExbB proton channel family protein [Alphaproteobacteria bacterium]